jgi:hypothetical protein
MDLPPSAPSTAPGDASRERRLYLKLREKDPIRLQNLCPISKYYAAADIVLEQFKQHLADGDLDSAYIIGRRFALFSAISLPGHDYYLSPNPELIKLRRKNLRDAEWVTKGLERIVKVMDRQEIEKQNAELDRIRIRKEDEEREQRRHKEEEERKKMEWEQKMKQRLTAGESSSGSTRLCVENGGQVDLISRLASLNTLYPKEESDEEPKPAPSTPQQDNIENQTLPPLPPPLAPPIVNELGGSSALAIATSAVDQLKSSGMSPMFEEPPTYSDLFLDALRTSSTGNSTELHQSTSSFTPSVAIPIMYQPRVPIRKIQQNCSQMLQSFIDAKQIEFIRLGTYQGRLANSSPKYDSTNGCAVISPLVVATHIYPQYLYKKEPELLLQHQQYLHGISNVAINEIIDKRAPPILTAVRSKLGLSEHALIIPSDVHDYLVDVNILPQDKFVGVCGGDLLDECHLKELVEMIVNGGEDSKKCKSVRKLKVGAGE